MNKGYTATCCKKVNALQAKASRMAAVAARVANAVRARARAVWDLNAARPHLCLAGRLFANNVCRGQTQLGRRVAAHAKAAVVTLLGCAFAFAAMRVVRTLLGLGVGKAFAKVAESIAARPRDLPKHV